MGEEEKDTRSWNCAPCAFRGLRPICVPPATHYHVGPPSPCLEGAGGGGRYGTERRLTGPRARATNQHSGATDGDGIDTELRFGTSGSCDLDSGLVVGDGVKAVRVQDGRRRPRAWHGHGTTQRAYRVPAEGRNSPGGKRARGTVAGYLYLLVVVTFGFRLCRQPVPGRLFPSRCCR